MLIWGWWYSDPALRYCVLLQTYWFWSQTFISSMRLRLMLRIFEHFVWFLAIRDHHMTLKWLHFTLLNLCIYFALQPYYWSPVTSQLTQMYPTKVKQVHAWAVNTLIAIECNDSFFSEQSKIENRIQDANNYKITMPSYYPLMLYFKSNLMLSFLKLFLLFFPFNFLLILHGFPIMHCDFTHLPFPSHLTSTLETSPTG